MSLACSGQVLRPPKNKKNICFVQCLPNELLKFNKGHTKIQVRLFFLFRIKRNLGIKTLRRFFQDVENLQILIKKKGTPSNLSLKWIKGSIEWTILSLEQKSWATNT